MQDRDEAETAKTDGGRDAGHIGEGVPRLWDTYEGGDRVQIPREGARQHG